MKTIILSMLLLTGCECDRGGDWDTARAESQKAWEESRVMQRESIALCKERGGVPIVTAFAQQLTRCDFPWPDAMRKDAAAQ